MATGSKKSAFFVVAGGAALVGVALIAFASRSTDSTSKRDDSLKKERISVSSPAVETSQASSYPANGSAASVGHADELSPGDPNRATGLTPALANQDLATAQAVAASEVLNLEDAINRRKQEVAARPGGVFARPLLDARKAVRVGPRILSLTGTVPQDAYDAVQVELDRTANHCQRRGGAATKMGITFKLHVSGGTGWLEGANTTLLQGDSELVRCVAGRVQGVRIFSRDGSGSADVKTVVEVAARK